MSNNPGGKNDLSDDEIRDTLAAWAANYPNITKAGRELGLARQTMQRRLVRLGVRKEKPGGRAELKRYPDEQDYELPQFPQKQMDAVDLIDQMERQFIQEDEYFRSLKWFEIKVRKKEPIGVCWVGDPHLGPKCNIPLLKRDVKIMSETPGVYAINLGDVVDNWGGRLLRLYADTNISRETERTLARWFLLEAGIPWWCWLEGNHEGFDGALTAFLKASNANSIPMVDWRAQFKICFPSGSNVSEVKIDCAHDYKGHSMWNDLHALERASKMSGTDVGDIYVAGHRHLWEHKKLEIEDGRVITLIRARGYKWIDDYAHRHQFFHRRVGASVMTVIDPMAESADAVVTPFSDLAEGAKYLGYLRARA